MTKAGQKPLDHKTFKSAHSREYLYEFLQTQVCLMTLLGGGFCCSWLIVFYFCPCIRNPNAGFTVKTRMGGLSAGGVPSAVGHYKGGFLQAAAHWRDIFWTGSLLRMWTVVVLLFLAVASPSVASKCRSLKYSRPRELKLNLKADFYFQTFSFHVQTEQKRWTTVVIKQFSEFQLMELLGFIF